MQPQHTLSAEESPLGKGSQPTHSPHTSHGGPIVLPSDHGKTLGLSNYVKLVISHGIFVLKVSIFQLNQWTWK